MVFRFIRLDRGYHFFPYQRSHAGHKLLAGMSLRLIFLDSAEIVGETKRQKLDRSRVRDWGRAEDTSLELSHLVAPAGPSLIV